MNPSILMPLLLFFIDYTAFVLLDTPLVLSLICYFILQLFAKSAFDISCYISLLCLGLYSFMVYANGGFIYLIIFPTILASFFAKKYLIKAPLITYGILALFILLQNLLLYPILGVKRSLIIYTIRQYCVNIWVMLIISLIISVAGKQDNRL